MASAFAETTTPIEKTPRRALLWGGGLLVLGLAAVGVGQADEGAALALAGLLITIYGIHRFGRLGPDDARPTTETERAASTLDTTDLAAARAGAVDAIWMGGLAVLAGAVVTAGSYVAATSTAGEGRYLVAYGAIIAGGIRLAQGYRSLSATRLAEAKVEKRRRLGKSRAP